MKPSDLGRVIRDITRKTAGGPKVYSLHAPEVECIGKGKPHKPYEFGVKVSATTTLKYCKGGQFVIPTHAQNEAGRWLGRTSEIGGGGPKF